MSGRQQWNDEKMELRSSYGTSWHRLKQKIIKIKEGKIQWVTKKKKKKMPVTMELNHSPEYLWLMVQLLGRLTVSTRPDVHTKRRRHREPCAQTRMYVRTHKHTHIPHIQKQEARQRYLVVSELWRVVWCGSQDQPAERKRSRPKPEKKRYQQKERERKKRKSR